MQFISHSLKETEEFAQKWLTETVKNKKETGATVVCLYGDLGSGKTTFTQFLAKALGVTDQVTSPTFVIEKKYSTTDETFKTLVHLDCYRLIDGKDMAVLGWQETLADSSALVIVEWPERIQGALPENYLSLEFQFVGENERQINAK